MTKTLITALCLVAAITGCGQSKSGGGASPVNPYYPNGYYQNGMGYPPGYPGGACPGFQNQMPYAPANGGWGYNNGNMYVNGNMNNNGPFRASCNQYQNQYQLNYYRSGACSFLTQSTGKIYQEIVFPSTQQVTCAEMSTVQTAYNYGTPMAMNTYQGAMIGCVPGYYVPAGCNCVGAGASGGVNFGIWAGGFGIGFGVSAGTGMQSAGICY